MRLAVGSKYSRALSLLHDVPFANTTSDTVLRQLHTLHHGPTARRHFSNSVQACSASGPHRCPSPASCSLAHDSIRSRPRSQVPLLHLLAITANSSQVEIIGLSTLTALLNHLTKRELPASVLALCTAATLLLPQPCLDRICLIAIGQALTTTAFPPMAIRDISEQFFLGNLADLVRTSTDSTKHDCTVLSKR